MGILVHIYANDSKEEGEPADTAPKRAAATGARSIGVVGIAGLKTAFKTLLTEHVKISRLVIETHGTPGAMKFGSDRLEVTKLSEFRGQGFEDLFEDNARIFLNGCNIAKIGHDCSGTSCVVNNGREFLREFARIFLIKSGGRVGASTSLGTVFKGISDKVFHLPGFEVDGSGVHWEDSKTIYAYINKGGSKVRIAVGQELSTPVKSWKVVADGKDWLYDFTSVGGNKVSYEDTAIFNSQSGKGTWQIVGDMLRVNWESGSSEEWDLPLFTGEQPIVWKKKDGGIQNILATKLVDSGRSID